MRVSSGRVLGGVGRGVWLEGFLEGGPFEWEESGSCYL